VRGEYGTDQLVDREFEPWTLESRTPIFNQRLTMQRRWGKHSLNVDLENDQRDAETDLPVPTMPPNLVPITDYNRTDRNITRRLPEAEYRSSGVQLGGRRWVSLSTTASLGGFNRFESVTYDAYDSASEVVYRSRATELDHEYWRADVYPQLRFPIGWSWLEVIPEINGRATWWSAQQGASQAGDPLATIPSSDPFGDPREESWSFTPTLEEDVFLWAWDAALRFQGPDFERIYNRDAEAGQRKWQHLIEPRVEFLHAPDIDERPLISGDQVAGYYRGRFADTRQRIVVGLVNTIRSRTVLPPGEPEASPRDVVRWTLSTEYDLKKASTTGTVGGRPADSRWTNISSNVEIKPSDLVHFSLRQTYNILQDDLTSTSLVGGVDGRWGYVDLAFSTDRDPSTLDATRTDLSMTGEHWFYRNDRIRLGYDFTRDFEAEGDEEPWVYRRVVVSYFNQCCGVSLSWEDNALRSIRREKEWELMISLRDLGNYLRYRKRTQVED
jgi:hypothetical protein